MAAQCAVEHGFELYRDGFLILVLELEFNLESIVDEMYSRGVDFVANYHHVAFFGGLTLLSWV